MTSFVSTVDVVAPALRRAVLERLAQPFVVEVGDKIGRSSFRGESMTGERVRVVRQGASSRAEAVVAVLAEKLSIDGFPIVLGRLTEPETDFGPALAFRWIKGEPGTALHDDADWTPTVLRERLASVARHLRRPVEASDASSRQLEVQLREVVTDFERDDGPDFQWGGVARSSVFLLLPEITEIVHRGMAADGPVAIVHGDLHPGNVVLGCRGVHVIDAAYRWDAEEYDEISWAVSVCELGFVTDARVVEMLGRLQVPARAIAIAVLRICGRLSTVLTGAESAAARSGVSAVAAARLWRLLTALVIRAGAEGSRC